jgi:hypothetical protein
MLTPPPPLLPSRVLARTGTAAAPSPYSASFLPKTPSRHSFPQPHSHRTRSIHRRTHCLPTILATPTCLPHSRLASSPLRCFTTVVRRAHSHNIPVRNLSVALPPEWTIRRHLVHLPILRRTYAPLSRRVWTCPVYPRVALRLRVAWQGTARRHTTLRDTIPSRRPRVVPTLRTVRRYRPSSIMPIRHLLLPRPCLRSLLRRLAPFPSRNSTNTKAAKCSLPHSNRMRSCGTTRIHLVRALPRSHLRLMQDTRLE